MENTATDGQQEGFEELANFWYALASRASQLYFFHLSIFDLKYLTRSIKAEFLSFFFFFRFVNLILTGLERKVWMWNLGKKCRLNTAKQLLVREDFLLYYNTICFSNGLENSLVPINIYIFQPFWKEGLCCWRLNCS